MKKITLALAFLLTMVMSGYGQVTVGEGTNTAQVLPFNAYYGYTYSQSIYLASEINASGSITSIQWYFSGTGAMPNSQNLTIYLGQTTKSSFDTDLDYVALSGLTSVYTGGIVTGGTAGWKTITFTTPFAYDGISNLVVAVDENMSGYDGSADDFRNTNVGSNRSIFVYDDTMNADPADPTVDSSGYPERGLVQYVPNIIFGGITQACGNPTGITASMATTTEATIAWTAASGQTDWEVYVTEQSMDAPTTATVGTDVTGTASYVKTGLLSNTGYNVYVRAKCSASLFSGWSGPTNFRTLCDPFGDFSENFDSTTPATGVVPNCWTKKVVSTNVNANVSVVGSSASSTPNAISMSNSGDAAAGLYLTTPALISIGDNTHRIAFEARGSGTDFPLIVGTMSDPTDETTFVALETITLTNTYAIYSVALTTSTTANHVAFKHGGGGTYRSIYIDNFVWESIPLGAPNCSAITSPLDTATSVSSGKINWTTNIDATGFFISIGTSAGATDIQDMLDIGNVTSYTFPTTPGVTYYVKLSPYNANGTNSTCSEISFTTCDSSGDIAQNFDALTAGTGVVPSCWTKTIVSSNTSANVSIIGFTAASSPNAIQMTNSADATAGIYLATPALTAIGANTHRIKFNARGGATGQILSVGTMSNPSDPTTFVELQSLTLTNVYTSYNISLNTSTTANHIAFKHGLGGTYRSVYLDDVLWEPIPSTPPGCIQDMNAVVNQNCGNFSTVFTWTAVPGADGYKVSIGTSPNGQDLVVDEQDILNATTYSFAGNAMTSYYYSVVPYNANGSAIGCFEDFFQTADGGCYCVGVPTSVDNSGITNVQINQTDFPVTPATAYSDLTLVDQVVDITRGVNTVMNVTLATQYSYFTNVWVDFNDNYTFEPSELVHEGVETPSTSPYIDNTSFMTPVTAGLGVHRMRIVTTDNKTVPSNPCYTGSYGVVVDLKVNVLEAPSCLPPTASTVSQITATSATLNWVSDATLFNIELDFAGFTQGTGTITSGISGNTTTLTDLDPQQDYAYYIQTDCGSGSESPWTGPFTFRTGCTAFGDFTEDFTTEVSYTVPECFSSLIVSTISSPSINVYNYNDYVGMATSGDAAAELYFISPALTDLPLSTHRMKFKALSYSTGVSVIVGTMSDPSQASTFTAVETIPVTSPFADYSVLFDEATTDMYVAFKFVGTATYQTLYIDNLVWETAPLCADVNIVSFDSATSSSADVSWTPGGSEEAWQYAYAEATVTSPEGLDVTDVMTTPMATISDLDPSTEYKVWVRSVCGTSLGVWSPAISFYTSCVAFDTPFMEDFTAYVPLCWLRAAEGSVATGPIGEATGIWLEDGFLNVGTTGAVKANLYNTNRIGWLISPSINTTVGESYTLSFDYGVTTWNATTESAMGSDDFVKIAMTTDNGVTWTEVESITAADNVTNVSQEFSYEFTATTAETKFALIASDGTVDDSQDYDFFIDNVTFESPLSNTGFDNNTFTAYPNPVKDMLNVSFTQNISNVTVYNLLGQQVLFMNMNANKGQVDMSNLASGTYLVKVNAENAVKTIKVIKQ